MAIFESGYEFPKVEKSPITREQMVRFAGASGDFNPLHYDDSIGKRAGIGGVIAHGMLIMGITGEAITHWIPRKALKKFGVRFKAMTFPGDVITVTGQVLEKEETAQGTLLKCSVAAQDQNGQVKLSGNLEALVDA